MKNLTKVLTVTIGMMFIAQGIAFSETKFTPLNFEDSKAVTATSNTVKATQNSGTIMLDPTQVTGGNKMQSAITQLDNAQVEVRNQLLNYRTTYAEIDGKYQTTKAERKAAKKKIKQAEKQIKNMENAKNKIRKNFEQKNNI